MAAANCEMWSGRHHRHEAFQRHGDAARRGAYGEIGTAGDHLGHDLRIGIEAVDRDVVHAHAGAFQRDGDEAANAALVQSRQRLAAELLGGRLDRGGGLHALVDKIGHRLVARLGIDHEAEALKDVAVHEVDVVRVRAVAGEREHGRSRRDVDRAGGQHRDDLVGADAGAELAGRDRDAHVLVPSLGDRDDDMGVVDGMQAGVADLHLRNLGHRWLGQSRSAGHDHCRTDCERCGPGCVTIHVSLPGFMVGWLVLRALLLRCLP